MHIHEEYGNHPYHPPTLTSNQQQQIEKDLTMMTKNRSLPI